MPPLPRDSALCPSRAALSPEDSPGRLFRRVIWLVGFSHATNHFVMLIFPAVLLLVGEEFSLGYSGLGLLANVPLLAYGIGALPAGMLADRLGGRRMLWAWLLGGSAACVGIAFSKGPLSLAAGLAVLGLFASIHHPAGSGMLVAFRDGGEPDVGRAFGLCGLLGTIGLAASPLCASLVGVWWGWRSAFLMGAIPTLLVALHLWRDYGSFSPRCQAPPVSESSLPIPLRRALTVPLGILFALETLQGFVFQGFSTFLPAYLADFAQIPGLTADRVTRGGAFASVALLFGGAGHVAAGRLMALRHRVSFFLLLTVGSALFLFGMAATGGLWLILFSIALSFGNSSIGTVSNTFIAVHTPPHLGGTAFAITFTLAIGVGSLAPGVMGFVADRVGLAAVFLALGVISLVAAPMVVWFGRATTALPGPAAGRLQNRKGGEKRQPYDRCKDAPE